MNATMRMAMTVTIAAVLMRMIRMNMTFFAGDSDRFALVTHTTMTTMILSIIKRRHGDQDVDEDEDEDMVMMMMMVLTTT